MKTVSPSGVKSSFIDFYRINSEADFKENLEAGVWGIREPREIYENLPRMTGPWRNSSIDKRWLGAPQSSLMEVTGSTWSSCLEWHLIVICHDLVMERAITTNSSQNTNYRRCRADGISLRYVSQYSTTRTLGDWQEIGGLALEEQVLDEGTIPMTETDAHLDILITSTDVISRENTKD